MSEEINIQAMEPSDILELLVIWRMTPGMSLRKRDDSSEKLELFICRNADYCFTAKKDGKLIGGVLCGSDARRAIIYHTVVLEDYRNKGVGGRLIKAVLEALEKDKIGKAYLSVDVDNAAGLKFWLGLGFEEAKGIRWLERKIAVEGNEKI